MENGGISSAISGTIGDSNANETRSADHLLTTPAQRERCGMCDGSGYKDHAGFAMDPCDHVRAAPGGGVQSANRAGHAGGSYSSSLEHLHTPRPLADWHEDMGDVLWHLMPIKEPPHCGTPIDTGWPYFEEDEPRLWFTPLPDARAIDAAWRAVAGDDLGEGSRHG